MGPPFVAFMMMTGPPGGSGCSKGPSQAPPAETPAPPAMASTTPSSAPVAAASSAPPAAASSTPPAVDPASDGGFGASRPREHLFLAEYRGALRYWMTPDEQARAATVDTERTDRGSVAKMALLAADAAVRVLSPLGLDARGYHEEATTLRSLAPIVDRRTVDAAASALEPIQQRTNPDIGMVLARPLGIENPLAWASLALEQTRRRPGATPHSGVIAAMTAGAAVRDGAPRAAAVDAAIDLLRTTAAAARPGPR